VVRVDELAAELAHLPVRPVAAAVRVHAAADPVGSLVHGRRDPLVLQRERGVEPGDPAADDRNARGRACRSACGVREQDWAGGDPGADDAAPLQELAAGVRLLGPPLAELGRTEAEPFGVVVLPGDALDCPQQRRPCHPSVTPLGRGPVILSGEAHLPFPPPASREGKMRGCEHGVDLDSWC
jgi:hypothetical protein